MPTDCTVYMCCLREFSVLFINDIIITITIIIIIK